MRVAVACTLMMLVACATDPHPGFKEVADGVHMRLHALGDGAAVAAEQDSLLLRIRITPYGSTSSYTFAGELICAVRELRKGALAPVFQQAHEGDSLSIVASAEAFPWVHPAGGIGQPVDGSMTLLAELRLLEIITPNEMELRRRNRLNADALSVEQRIIHEWMEEERAEGFQRWGTSMVFYRAERRALTVRPLRPGDLVRIDCEGSRVADGVVVDDSRRHGGSYAWRHGDAGQVIPGLELAAQLFGHGGGGHILLPAEYAFGADGVEGSVPPQCPLLYHVRSVTIIPADP
jgi:FKBP-type peptidyl-prolyl cis-trans isomerase